MDKYAAVLIDIMAIQKYIYGTNKLKDQLGASYIVKHIYKNTVENTLIEIYGKRCWELGAWREDPEDIKIGNGVIRVETAFEGGGKLMLLFTEEDKANKFISIWSSKLLLEFPGIKTAVAVAKVSIEKNNFQTDIDEIFSQLLINKQSYLPEIDLPSHGITYDCPRTGFTAQTYNFDSDYLPEQHFISSEAFIKIQHYKMVKEEFASLIENKSYVFPEMFNQMGQMKGNNFLAVIHMDGNNMGQMFKECKDLVEYRKLAIFTENITETAFKNTVKRVIELCDEEILTEEMGFKLKHGKQNHLIPLIPLVLGGDEVTLICHGFLGMYLAEFLLEEWVHLASDMKLSACAGVAIMPTTYPIYRGYAMAEQLCANAKKMARQNNNTSWLDFYLPIGELHGDLNKLREKHRFTRGLNLNFGPYYLARGEKNINIYKDRNIKSLKEGVNYFNTNWPRSKCKELRTAISNGKEILEEFVDKQKTRGLELPNIYENYHNSGHYSGHTPYAEVLNLMDFYPHDILKLSLSEHNGKERYNGEVSY